MKKSFAFYTILIGIFGILLWVIIRQGEANLKPGGIKTSIEVKHNQPAVFLPNVSSWDVFLEGFHGNVNLPLSRLILQLISIVAFSRAFGYLFTKIRQPSVIGEIIAGIILGPSVVGMFFPEFSNFLFPADSLKNLQFLSQIGLILFMFIIGMELDIKVLKNKAHNAVVISHASIIIPYCLGVCLAYYLYESFAPDNISFTAFALFMGIAMSITAFPVLARILQERGMTKSPLGTMAITCAAADDVTAWCILATVVAIVQAGSFSSALYTIALSVIYVMFMLMVIQPFLRRLGSIYISRENLNKKVIAFVFLILLGSSYLTEIIGIHALFGAFLAGVIMPNNINFKRVLSEKIEDVSLVLLLPLFFVLTGLRTEISLLNDQNLWITCGLIIIVAIVGKFGGSALAAKVVGQSWKDSLALGALMNTRGLMELIVLNIGYDLGILNPQIFAMMVLMALVTTFMTGPSLDLILKFNKTQLPDNKILNPDTYKILLSFGPPKMGSTLLKLASQIIFKENLMPKITALHMTPHTEVTAQETLLYEKEGFKPIKETAQQLGIKISTKYKATEEISREIVHEASEGNFDLLLLGSAKSLFSENMIGGKIKEIFEESTSNIGVLVDKGFNYAQRILMIIDDQNEINFINFGLKFIKTGAKITLMDRKEARKSYPSVFDNIPQKYLLNKNIFEIIEETELTPEFQNNFDLILVSLAFWKENDNKNNLAKSGPSILIFKSSSLDTFINQPSITKKLNKQ